MEGKNLEPLVKRVTTALEGNNLRNQSEIIIVDDNSKDESKQLVTRLEKEGFPVRIIVRTNERGLSSAVLRGFDEARGKYLLCMDSDLQHPPEKVPELVQALEDGNDFVLGTRYGKDVAIDKDWPLYRRVISGGARLLARPLTPLSDPMSGFFGLTKTMYQRAKMNGASPVGFKIALELYVKSGAKKYSEVPFSFGVRVAGYSKLSQKVIVQYLVHLSKLYQFKHPLVLILLVIVGLVLFYLFAQLVSRSTK